MYEIFEISNWIKSVEVGGRIITLPITSILPLSETIKCDFRKNRKIEL